MTEQWLSIVEYARTFKVSDMTIRRRIKTGKLHAILQDGKYFIPVSGNGGAPKPTITPAARHYPESSTFTNVPHSSAFGQTGAPSHAPSLQGKAAEINVLKGQHISVKPVNQIGFRQDEGARDADATIPASLRRPLGAQETSLVDTRALLAFCEASLRKMAENERRVVEKFKSKLETLEATLANRDLENKALRQQLEDLQLLVKILERRKTS